MIYTKESIQRALNLPDFDPLAAQSKMLPRPRGNRPIDMPGDPRVGSVLVILYPRNGETYLVLTRRRDDLNDHAGQISFPGGQREVGETLQTAALREAHEEVGVSPSALAVLGELSTTYIPPTDFEVHPFVAWHESLPDFKPQDREVAEILEVSISHLLDPVNRHEDAWDIQGYTVQVPYYLFGSHKVWGATAIMLSEFLERLRFVK